MKRSFALAAAALLWLAACSPASLSVMDAWSRPTPAGGTAAAYFTLQNGPQADALIGASSDIAATVEIHENVPAGEAEDMGSTSDEEGEIMSMDGDNMGMDTGGDVMIMRPVHRLDLAANQEVTFEPGGYHAMLIDLQQELKAGDTFELTLHFEQVGDVTVQVMVKEQ